MAARPTQLTFESDAATLPQLVATARALLPSRRGLSPAEQACLSGAPGAAARSVLQCRAAIRRGEDPLGEALLRIRPGDERRRCGAVYTPAAIVREMMRWAATQPQPSRVVDPGAGSGRFLIAAARLFPRAELHAVECDAVAALLLRANAAVLGFSDRLTVAVQDYRAIELAARDGPTLFVGNPPYVRHHDISEQWKTWFAESASRFGLRASKLAGLHIHFFLKTRMIARPGDYGAFVTSAEWLEVNYGSVLRRLLSDGLGGTAVHVLAPNARPFADALTTGAITCFRVGSAPERIILRRVERIDELRGLDASTGTAAPVRELASARKWSVASAARGAAPADRVELGQLFRVHRGQVSGANAVFVSGNYPGDVPDGLLLPTVTRARELISAGDILKDCGALRRVIDIPPDLDKFSTADRAALDRFLAWARRQGAHETYIARHRRAWWSVGLRDAAPILCTYMARRPPVFVRNLCGARHLNIAHGLYPRESLTDAALRATVRFLNGNVRVESGRTYAGGLTKFEPRELERVLIPRLEHLNELAAALDAR